MKSRKKLEGASSWGVKIKHDPSLDQLSGKVLFPEKVKAANEVLAGLKVKLF